MEQERKKIKQKKAYKKGHNEGTIRMRKDGTYEARYRVGNLRKSIYGKTKPEVKSKLQIVLANITKGDHLEPCKVKFYDWLIEWLKTYKKNTIRETTYESHKSAIDKHIKNADVGKLTISALKPIHFQKLYNDKLKTLSAGTIKRLHVTLKDALKQSVNCDMISKNPLDKLSPPTIEKKEIKILTKKDQQKFINGVSDLKLGLAFLLAMQTGLRKGELLALRWDDIDIAKKILNVKRNVQRVNGRLLMQEPKTKTSRRMVPIMPQMIEQLENHKKEQNKEKMRNRKIWDKNNFVFCTEFGQIIDPRRFQDEFKDALKECELSDYNFHALRHTFVSNLLDAGENPKVICELIGHTKVAFMLETYAHLFPESKHDAINKISHLFQKNQIMNNVTIKSKDFSAILTEL
jgi:integrase